ncbi:MAG: hypothetical protein H7039_22445 [Bryobacteraceae bacterium]|nr:hypothetical protein [Bryobacteraceae bacterium]
MSIGTEVTLDDDVSERVKQESRVRGTSVRDTVNNLIRVGLNNLDAKPRRTLEIRPTHMGHRPELNYDSVDSLLEYGETEQHR